MAHVARQYTVEGVDVNNPHFTIGLGWYSTRAEAKAVKARAEREDRARSWPRYHYTIQPRRDDDNL